MSVTTTQAVSPGYIYTVTASSEAIVRDVETNKLLCKANEGSQGMFVAIGGTVSMTTDDSTATITQSSTTSGGARFEVHQTRPTLGEEGVIYLIPITSSTDEDNEYEEWIWVKGEWERLGTTGVNLSNYATLTGANTYSGNNTFNGLLTKKNSSSLGDTSVLNRYESDSRYGRLTANNTWQGVQYITSGSTLTLHPQAILIVNNIQGSSDGDGQLNFNSLHLANIDMLDASAISTAAIKVLTGQTPNISIDTSKIEAFQLNTALFGADKYGLRITPESCQLFGLDFAYGDRWVETALASDLPSTAIQGLQLPSAFDVIKIDKANISLKSTNIASLSFDYANKAYFKAFPNDGQPAIFEFVSGHNRAAGEAGPNIRLGPVDVRKASLPSNSLHPYSLLNKEEVSTMLELSSDSGLSNVLVDYELSGLGDSAVTTLKSVTNVNVNEAYGIAIGPGVTANIYRDIAIGGSLNTSLGQGRNTLLGYGFSLSNAVSDVVVIGQGNNTTIDTSNTVFIGKTSATFVHGLGAVAINGAINGNQAIAINGTANGSAAIAIGLSSTALTSAVAIGESAAAGVHGTALGAYSIANEKEIALQAGAGPVISMRLYSGDGWDNRNTTGYLRFVTAKDNGHMLSASTSDREEITIHKKPLWDAIQRAKDYNYPAQPYEVVTDVQTWSQILKQNAIYALDNSDDLNLESLTFDNTISGIPTAELWITLSNDYAPPTVAWPVQMLWPDEPDATIAPVLDMPVEGYNRTYCITIRKHKIGTNDLGFVASVAYCIDTAV